MRVHFIEFCPKAQGFSMLKKVLSFFLKPVASPAVAKLYQSIVAAARRPSFYTELGVPDTVDGRFDLIVLHICLLMRRLPENSSLRQPLFDLFFSDMDRNLREMGVGDMSVGKKMRPMFSAFYGRLKAYSAALAGEEDLVNVLKRNVYREKVVGEQNINFLAAYVRRSAAMLEEQTISDLAAGDVCFPAAEFDGRIDSAAAGADSAQALAS